MISVAELVGVELPALEVADDPSATKWVSPGIAISGWVSSISRSSVVPERVAPQTKGAGAPGLGALPAGAARGERDPGLERLKLRRVHPGAAFGGGALSIRPPIPSTVWLQARSPSRSSRAPGGEPLALGVVAEPLDRRRQIVEVGRRRPVIPDRAVAVGMGADQQPVDARRSTASFIGGDVVGDHRHARRPIASYSGSPSPSQRDGRQAHVAGGERAQVLVRRLVGDDQDSIRGRRSGAASPARRLSCLRSTCALTSRRSRGSSCAREGLDHGRDRLAMAEEAAGEDEAHEPPRRVGATRRRPPPAPGGMPHVHVGALDAELAVALLLGSG